MFDVATGMVPGGTIVVESDNRLADSVALRPDVRRTVSLGTVAAATMLVVPA